jgi:hypothetical protein
MSSGRIGALYASSLNVYARAVGGNFPVFESRDDAGEKPLTGMMPMSAMCFHSADEKSI